MSGLAPLPLLLGIGGAKLECSGEEFKEVCVCPCAVGRLGREERAQRCVQCMCFVFIRCGCQWHRVEEGTSSLKCVLEVMGRSAPRIRTSESTP